MKEILITAQSGVRGLSVNFYLFVLNKFRIFEPASWRNDRNAFKPRPHVSQKEESCNPKYF